MPKYLPFCRKGVKMVYIMSRPERFVRIPGFPNYQVSNYGDVINIAKGKKMTMSPNQNGDLTVGISRDNHQSRKSVKVLVARAFCQGETDIMNTVVQLDGDQNNVVAWNLVWRPRWFAWRFNKQYEDIPDWAWVGPIKDEVHGGEYEHMVDAAMVLGVLIDDIRRSMRMGVPVFPFGMTFAFV